MALEEDTAWVVWPEYFDVRRSRKEGRKVNRRLCVSSPTLESVIRAVEMLGLEYKVEEDKAYPSNWWRRQGRVLVENSIPKSRLLVEIAKKMER